MRQLECRRPDFQKPRAPSLALFLGANSVRSWPPRISWHSHFYLNLVRSETGLEAHENVWSLVFGFERPCHLVFDFGCLRRCVYFSRLVQSYSLLSQRPHCPSIYLGATCGLSVHEKNGGRESLRDRTARLCSNQGAALNIKVNSSNKRGEDNTLEQDRKHDGAHFEGHRGQI